MRIDHANSRWRAPRLLGIAALLLAILVVMLVSYSGGASAAPPADLSITKTDSPDPVVQGDNLTYTIRVTNGGPNAATDVACHRQPARRLGCRLRLRDEHGRKLSEGRKRRDMRSRHGCERR